MPGGSPPVVICGVGGSPPVLICGVKLFGVTLLGEPPKSRHGGEPPKSMQTWI